MISRKKQTKKRTKKMFNIISKDINDYEVIGVRVLVEVEHVKEKTAGGILLTEDTRRTEQDLMTNGTLIKAGNIAFDDMCPDGGIRPKIGDHVFFVKYAGKEIEIGDKYYRVVRKQNDN